MRNHLRTLLTSLLLAVGLGGLTLAATGVEAEASMNFDLDAVKPFLEKLATIFTGGFDERDRSALATAIAGLKVEGKLTRSYSVVFEGRRMPLRIVAMMDDLNAPDLFFFAPPTLATRIDAELQRFAQQRGW